MLRQLQQRLLGPAESRSDRVRRLSRAWLLVVSSLIAGSVAFTFVRLRARIAEYFDERTEQLVSAIDAQLDLIDSDYQRQTSADLNLAFLAISGDTASSESAWIHALEEIQKNQKVDLIVGLQATSPLRGKNDIDLLNYIGQDLYW